MLLNNLKKALFLAVLVIATLPGAVFAGSDECQGDTSIYTGLPTTTSTPNVMIIIDNSRATLNMAPGAEYIPGATYPAKAGCGVNESAPSKGCYLDNYIYTIDNQGDVANQHVLANTTSVLENLKKPTTFTDPIDAGTSSTCNDSSDVIRKSLVQRGTYSGAGSTTFPNIGANGVCDTSPKGAVYVLGRYLRYTQTSVPAVLPVPASVPDVCKVPNPIVKAHEWKSGNWTSNKFAFFQLKTTAGATHTSSSSSELTPYDAVIGSGPSAYNNPQLAFWDELPTSPAPANFSQWLPSTPYTRTLDIIPPDDPIDSNPDGKTCAQLIAAAATTTTTTTTPTATKTQREVVYSALKRAVGAAVGSVRFGAMVYGTNNSGGEVVSHMKDLSAGAIDSSGNLVDCADSGNSTVAYCQFLAALPGIRKDPSQNPPFSSCNDFYGAGCVSSNTGRPQAEAVYDAGYYFDTAKTVTVDGITKPVFDPRISYPSITNTLKIPNDVVNDCNLNHIILITNGFTNGDGSPKLTTNIGDYDKDGYPDESVYGLGSHYLDDVTNYLQSKHKITTHAVLAFQERDSLIEDAAVVDGGGSFYQAYNEEGLSKALLDLFAGIINESSTSFVAPVVPASTTNRTVSSNKVYLGLFRPQENDIWHGNIKKYSIGLTDELLAADGTPATDHTGKFNRDKISYWSLRDDDMISSANGDISSTETDINKPKGDGGQVDAGGAGGKLLKRVQDIAAAIKSQNTMTPTLSTGMARDIYTLLNSSNSAVASVDTALTATQNRFVPGNANITTTTLGVSTDAGKRSLIRYVQGLAKDDLEIPSSAAARDWALGDILHSRPLVFNYTKYADAYENVCTPASTGAPYNSSVVFVGANDGMLHAFRDCDGSELWGFIPPNQLPHLKNLDSPISSGGHQTSVDAPPSAFVHDANGDGVIDPSTDKVILVIGQRRGGGINTLDGADRGRYYAIDVTVPELPVYLWSVGSGTGATEMGEPWSQPRIAKIKVTANQFKVVMFVGAGYDNNEDNRYGNTQTFLCDSTVAVASRPAMCNDTNLAPPGGSVDGTGPAQTSSGSVAAESRLAPRGRGLYAIELATMTRTDANSPYVPALSVGSSGADGPQGVLFWSYTAAQNSNMKYSFASDLTVLDMNGDGYSDRIYAGDTGGNLWRFDLSALDENSWSGEIMFTANSSYSGTYGRKVFYRPTMAMIGGAPHLYFGSGDREHPLNRAVTDRMYCVVDWKHLDNTITYPITEEKLEDVTLNALQDPSSDSASVLAILNRLYSSPSNPYDGDGNFRYGWYIKLDGTDRDNSGDPGEKVLAQPTVFNGEVFYSTYQLKTGVQVGCNPGNLGISRLYRLNYKTGEAIYNYDVSNDLNDGSTPTNERASGGDGGERLMRTDRARTLGEGIPSGIVTLIDASGKVTLLISSSDKVEASGLPDVKLITPVYWMQW